MNKISYYVVMERDGCGPAMGTGETELDAWDEASFYWDDDCGPRDGLECYEITGDSYRSIESGNVDDVEFVDEDDVSNRVTAHEFYMSHQ